MHPGGFQGELISERVAGIHLASTDYQVAEARKKKFFEVVSLKSGFSIVSDRSLARTNNGRLTVCAQMRKHRPVRMDLCGGWMCIVRPVDPVCSASFGRHTVGCGGIHTKRIR